MDYFLSTLNILVAGQGIFLVIILSTYRENRFANRLLAVLILILTLPSLGAYLSFFGNALPSYIISFFLFPMMFLHGPLIYFYTFSMTTGSRRVSRKTLLHIIPALIIFVIYIALNIRNGFQIINPPTTTDYFIKHIIFFFILLSSVSGLFYTCLSWIILHGYTMSIKEYFSNLIKLRLLWLKLLLGILLIMFLDINISILTDILKVEPLQNSSVLHMFSFLLNAFAIFMTAIFTLRQPDIFRFTSTMLSEFGTSGKYMPQIHPAYQKKKYEKYDIDDDLKTEYLSRITAYMKREKPYLDEDITLKDLASDIDIPSYHLSIIINEKLGQNFYTFINSYRIKEITRKLSDPENNKRNILDLAFESGFNSKSTFNNAFKNITGMTPTEFKQKGLS